MRSVTSSCKALLRSDLRRYWPVLFCYTFLWVLIQPIGLWNSARWIPEWAPEGISLPPIFAEVIYSSLPFTVISAAAFGVILAMTLYGYLMKSNSVGLMHALPVSRTAQYFTHFGAGMLMTTMGNLIVVAVTVLMELRLGTVEWKSLLWWLLLSELLVFFCFAFAAMCAMVTGWLLGIPVIFLGVNFLVKIYSLLLSGMGSTFYYGYSMDGGFTPAEKWLTPLYHLYSVFANRLDLGETSYDATGLSMQAVKVTVIYAVIGVAMLLLGWLFYRRRQSESAGDAIVFRWLKPIVRYAIAIAGGLGLGVALHVVLNLESGKSSELFLLGCQLVMGFVTYCAVEMLMRKRFKVFDKRTWIGLAVLAAVIAGLFVGMKADITGYESRVPAVEDVKSVYVNGDYLNAVTSEDPAFIEMVRDVHCACLDKKDAEALEGDGYYFWFRVEYTLNNGSKIDREYTILLSEEDEMIGKVNRLINSEIAKRENYLHGGYEKLCRDEAIGGYLYLWNIDAQIQITETQAKALQQAVLQDIETLPDRNVVNYDSVSLGCEIQLDLAGEESVYLSDLCTDFKTVTRLLQEYGIFDMVDVSGLWTPAEERNDPAEMTAAFGENYGDAELYLYGDKTFDLAIGEVSATGTWERNAREVFATSSDSGEEVVYGFTCEEQDGVKYLAQDGGAVGVDGLAVYWKLQ